MPTAIDVAYVVYQATDLDRMESFMQDFGLVTAEKRGDALYMRGASSAPFIHATRKGAENRFIGGGAHHRPARWRMARAHAHPGRRAARWGVGADAIGILAPARAQCLQRGHGENACQLLLAPQARARSGAAHRSLRPALFQPRRHADLVP